MPALIDVSRVTNANVYISSAPGGTFGAGTFTSLLGKAEEFEVTWPKAKMSDHKSLGMFGTGEFPAGIDKLETKIKWASIYGSVLATMSILVPWQFQVWADVQQFTSAGLTAEYPFRAVMLAVFKDGGPLNFKQHEAVDFTSTLAVYTCQYLLAGTEYLFYDLLSNQYRVNGVDQLANFRANIGAS